jgi:hypothetical protein
MSQVQETKSCGNANRLSISLESVCLHVLQEVSTQMVSMNLMWTQDWVALSASPVTLATSASMALQA